MKQIKILSSLFVFLLSACAGLQIPDVPICRPLDPIIVKKKDAFGIVTPYVRPNPVCMKEVHNPECGYCPYTVSDKAVYVGEEEKFWLYGKPWSKLKPESLTIPTESMARIKGSYMNACKQYDCSDPDIAKWRVKLDAWDSIGDAFKQP